MPVTIGQYEYTLDPKNRLVVPPRYREALIAEKGSHFILATGFDRCIWLFLPSQWESILQDSKDIAKSIKDKQQVRAFMRHLYGNSVEATLDEQGRILVPQTHKAYAALKKEVMIVGVGNKAEIWDRSKWNAYIRKQGSPAFEKLAKDLDL
jgi:MraZ protein